MNSKLLLIVMVLLLSLLGGGAGATAGQVTQASGGQKGQAGQGQSQIKLESSPVVQTGTGFTYQGRLVLNGSPASGSYDFTFSLYDAATGGNQIGSTIAVLTQTLSIGTFTEALDFGSFAFQGDARWLQIGVRPSGSPSYTILAPRQALTPAPYALSLMPGATISGTITSGNDTVLTVLNNGGTGLLGVGNDYGVEGHALASGGTGVFGDSFNGNNSVGVWGSSQATQGGFGVMGEAFGVNGTGVNGFTSGGGSGAIGVQGSSGSGTGVKGDGFNYGVWGTSTTGQGVRGESTSTNGQGVVGIGNTGSAAKGVEGVSTNGFGGYFLSGNSDGMYANSGSGPGIVASGGTDGADLTGSTYGVAATGGSRGVQANGGIYGVNAVGGGYGVNATATNSNGVGVVSYGALYGVNTAGGNTGVYVTGGTYGVYASITSGTAGVYGEANNAGGYFVGNANYGVYASGQGDGIYATSPGTGIYARGSGWAGYFQGNVNVTGTCCFAGDGTYKIDDPADPTNKYLNQAAVESPDMMDVYNGNVTLDANGEAVVTLPDYFQALNQDFRYQLTPIGAPGPNLYIAEEIKDNHFKIAGGKPNSKVSWLVTGIRHDPYTEQHPITVEQPKTGDEQGKYLYPAAYGQPDSAGVDYGKNPPPQKVAPPPAPKP